jgi:hypothetical protein
MIGYPIALADLENRIEEYSAGWLKRAATRTARFRTAGRYLEVSSIWSEVKVVYMELQGGSKCAFCERKLESSDLGKVEQDVEHFRPKGRVKPWKIPKSLSQQGVTITSPPKNAQGYYLLPYHPFNYSAACKPCNSALKKDHFPISGKYDFEGDDPSKLTAEKPLLICPIGDYDESPEDLIRFHGISPLAAAPRGYRRYRALVTIEFFKLDNEAKRKNLIRERAMIIVALFPQLEKLADGATGTSSKRARELVEGFTSPLSQHTNCARSYRKLFQQDRETAEELFNLASKLISSIS